MVVSEPIPFPGPREERYIITYNPVSGRVNIPLIPDEKVPAARILAVFIDLLIHEGTLTEDQVLQTVLQAVGDI